MHSLRSVVSKPWSAGTKGGGGGLAGIDTCLIGRSAELAGTNKKGQPSH